MGIAETRNLHHCAGMDLSYSTRMKMSGLRKLWILRVVEQF